MFSLLLFVVGVIVLIYFLARRPRSPQTPPAFPSSDSQLQQRNYEWAQFIAGYYALAQTDQERQIVLRMLADIEARGLPVPSRASVQQPTPAAGPIYNPYAAQPVTAEAAGLDIAAPPRARAQLDNTMLLLYFGAFLFVASAGLFVAFGGLPGGLRTFIVLMVSLVLYAGGMWLYDHRTSLRQAALTFVGIGMTIAPLTGLAAYNYLFDHSNGSVVWFMTSLFCALLYLYALIRLRQPLIAYIFIFTFLSLFESSVSIVSVPLYYYGWAMALMGLGLSVYSRRANGMIELREPSRASAMIFVPLSILVSLALVGSHGAGQLGVSLLVAAAYYWFEAVVAKKGEQSPYAVTAQISALTAATVLGYAATGSWPAAAAVLLAVGAAQIVYITWPRMASPLRRDAATIALGAQLIAVLLSVQRPWLLFVQAIGVVVFAAAVAWQQHRDDAYALAALSWITLPVIYGCVVMIPRLSAPVVEMLLLVALLTHFIVHLFLIRQKSFLAWRLTMRYVYVAACVVPLVATMWLSAWWGLGACAVVALTMVILAQYEKRANWMVGAGLAAAAPLLTGFAQSFDSAAFLAANIFALLCNVGGALWFRNEFNRWFSTVLWLLLPVALGSGVIGSWTVDTYAWAYSAAMLGLIFSRAVARGILWGSSKVALASLTRTASVSYVVGYCIAASLAITLSLYSTNSSVMTSVILALMTFVLWILSRYVEKWPDLLILVPISIQFFVLSAWRPAETPEQMIPYLLTSTALALLGYFGLTGSRVSRDVQQFVRDGSLITAFFVPSAALFADHIYWMMPVGLLVAALLTFDRVKATTQASRELAGGFVVIAIYWCMGYWGVHALQAYVHVLVALFAGYAYWRAYRGERAQSDHYIIAALIISTVPLALQAMSGAAGGLYGWWLLLEQIMWMLIGMAIGRRFVTMWGLYVAVGAVLYQLRNLGWAALTVLALFLIGLAVYRLQKTQK